MPCNALNNARSPAAAAAAAALCILQPKCNWSIDRLPQCRFTVSDDLYCLARYMSVSRKASIVV